MWAPDLPGFGLAQIPHHPLNLGDYVNFLYQYLQKNKLSQPILVGHSFGGRVCLKFQEMYPNYVRALILSGTPGFTPVAKRKIFIAVTLAKLGKIFFSLPLIRRFEEKVRLWYYYVVGARDYYRAEGVMRETFKKIVLESLVSSMKAVRAPTLLLWGEEDIIVPVKVAQKMQAVITHARLNVVPGADHGLPYKQPVKFAAYVNQFVNSL